MKTTLNRLSLIFLLISVVSVNIKSQTVLPEFLIGVMIHSSKDLIYTQHNNYYQIKDLGVNSVYQIAAKEVGGRQKNLDSLSLFEFIYMANDSGEGGYFGAKIPENIDWISYFTHAKYMKWEAEGSSLFQNNVKVKHEFGSMYNEGETSGWWSGNIMYSEGDIGKYLIKGPDYWQYPRYTYTNPGWNDEPIYYKAVFRMKIDAPSQIVMDVCEISVIQIKDNVETILKDEFDNPAVMVLTTEDLTTEYQDFILRYNYEGHFTSTESEESYPSRPTMFNNLFTENEAANLGMNEGAKVQFKVKWLGNRELFVDYIEVYDEKIWENYFIDNFSTLETRIINYHASFSELGEKLKYYGTLDEPHVVDCFEPLRRVQEIMDNNNIDATLLSHWYPGWDHYRDGDNTWPIYYELAQPKKINFWYAPFSNDSSTGIPHSRPFTLLYLAKNLQQAHLQQPDFYLTLQSWGDKKIGTSEYKTYMYPTNAELGAGTMLALAHGVKGIIYELYYTYPSSGSILVEGLVDTLVNGVFEPKPLWYKVQELAERLRGSLGNTLISTMYSGLFSNTHESNIPILEIYPQNTEGIANYHGGLLLSTDDQDNNYILFANIHTIAGYNINLRFSKVNSYYTNWKLKNVETGWEQSFIDTISNNTYYLAGEGKLFQVAPVVKYGGEILTNDTIKTNIALAVNMSLYDTVFIAEDKLYNINSDIDLQTNGFITGNGYITTDSGFSITTNSWNRSLLKGKQNNNPRLFWAAHPTLSGIINYKIYRKKESQTFELIATVSGTTYTYVDTTVNIVSGATQQNETIAEYYITAIYSISKGGQSESSASNTIKYHRVSGSPPQKSGQGDEASIVYTYNLEQNYPNPFNPTTTINYEVAPKKGTNTLVQIKVFDILGKEIATLVNEEKQEGRYSVNFDATHLSNGVYFYTMKSGDPSTSSGQSYFSVKKMILLK